MGATVHLTVTGALGVTSPPLAPSHCTCAGAKKQSCSLRSPRQQRRRLRVVEMGAPSGGEPSAGGGGGAVHRLRPRLLPDGTPDVHYRTARGGQKLRDVMLDGYIDLYGPYDKVLLNCSGGGVCGTCVVEVVEGKEMLSPKTEVEKELLKRKPKTWRLACQATVGNADSTGQMIIQQLPEWKIHEWDK
uniref:2Fe-2S ferredoxin-type domain-containing protein n=1 Tax=Zea mays TaxID=4577 RepID=A0A804MR04_MAIZE